MARKRKKHLDGRVVRELKSARLGVKPFHGGIKHYMVHRGAKLSPTTITEDSRKLPYFGNQFERWKSEGKISTTDPRHLEPMAITLFFAWMRQKNFKPETRRSYVKTLNRYLMTFGNYIIDTMNADGDIEVPREVQSEIKALEIDELREIFRVMDTKTEYWGIIIHIFIALAFGTGCRPKELFRAELRDLDLKNGMFYVRHPKGEGTWGTPEWVNIIRGDMLARLERLMPLLQAHWTCMGVKDPRYLFLNPGTGEPYEGGSIRKYKDRIAEESGVRFALKDMRSSLTTILIDEDYSYLESMSKQLRHKSTGRTKSNYLRINVTRAVRKNLGDRWKENEI